MHRWERYASGIFSGTWAPGSLDQTLIHAEFQYLFQPFDHVRDRTFCQPNPHHRCKAGRKIREILKDAAPMQGQPFAQDVPL